MVVNGFVQFVVEGDVSEDAYLWHFVVEACHVSYLCVVQVVVELCHWLAGE